MPAPAALIIIDMQQCMRLPEAGMRNNPQAEANMLALLAAWRAAGAPVMHVRHMSADPASLFWPGQAGAAFQAEFMPLPGEAVMERTYRMPSRAPVSSAGCMSGDYSAW